MPRDNLLHQVLQSHYLMLLVKKSPGFCCVVKGTYLAYLTYITYLLNCKTFLIFSKVKLIEVE